MDLREWLKSLPEKIREIPKNIKNLPEAIREAITGYGESYRNGVEKYGVWWKVFQFSIWAFVLIFLLTAVIIFVVYIPKIEMIQWDLR